uniref:4-hydroxybenzoate polyprenyltransferase, mitochondrial n=1 Tax=Strongyloides stercoralis TaxID=6248 RepID=A0A0K0DW14_STRER
MSYYIFSRKILSRKFSINFCKYISSSVEVKKFSINQFVKKFSASELVKKSPEPIQPYLYLMRLDKPIGTWLLYWPCTWSIALATPPGDLPSLYMLTLFGTGSILMRSAGCVINDLWDKDFDKRVERTKNRPLASGRLTEKQAIGLLGGLLTASLGILLQLNWLSIAVGASSMALVIGYPLAKRYTYWPQFILGATLNWGVLISGCHLCFDSAVSSSYILPLYISTICYTMVYDTIYSHQDKKDDIMIGVKSTALKFGDKTKEWLSGFSAITMSGLVLSGYMADQTWPYYLAILATSGHLAWQIKTVDINNSEDCWKKFKSNHYLGALLFAGIVAGNLLKNNN